MDCRRKKRKRLSDITTTTICKDTHTHIKENPMYVDFSNKVDDGHDGNNNDNDVDDDETTTYVFQTPSN